MKKHIHLIILLVCIPAIIQAQTGTANILTVAQRTDGSGLVDVWYSLTGTEANYNISMEVSFNSGTTFSPVGSAFLSGDAGVVSPGNNKHLLWNGKNTHNNTYSSQTKVKLIVSASCGQPLTITHVAGDVAPVNKTTTYGTVTGIAGEPDKCWITNNLGSDQQATAMNDGTEASAGWYWQFNLKQGYQYISSRIPATAWISSINENSDWITANDPCTIELGSEWRIPTYTEWLNVNSTGGWTDWNGPWNSGLKLHAAGYLSNSDGGSLSSRGSDGAYWCSTQNDVTKAWNLYFYDLSSDMRSFNKTNGFSLRCLRD